MLIEFNWPFGGEVYKSTESADPNALWASHYYYTYYNAMYNMPFSVLD